MSNETLETPGAQAAEDLIRFAAGLRFDALPPEVSLQGRRCLLNALGVALGACGDPAAEIALEVAREQGGEPQSRVLGYGAALPTRGTALVDGVLSHVLDYDDTHMATILHPSPPILSAVLPVGEWLDVSLPELITAFVAGVEVASRVSLVLFPDHYDRGWHITGTAGLTWPWQANPTAFLGVSIGFIERQMNGEGLCPHQSHRLQMTLSESPLHFKRTIIDTTNDKRPCILIGLHGNTITA